MWGVGVWRQMLDKYLIIYLVYYCEVFRFSSNWTCTVNDHYSIIPDCIKGSFSLLSEIYITHRLLGTWLCSDISRYMDGCSWTWWHIEPQVWGRQHPFRLSFHAALKKENVTNRRLCLCALKDRWCSRWCGEDNSLDLNGVRRIGTWRKVLSLLSEGHSGILQAIKTSCIRFGCGGGSICRWKWGAK